MYKHVWSECALCMPFTCSRHVVGVPISTSVLTLLTPRLSAAHIWSWPGEEYGGFLWTSAIGHFGVRETFTFKTVKTRENDWKTFLVKMSFLFMRIKRPFSYRLLRTYPRLETETQGNAKMAYWRFMAKLKELFFSTNLAIFCNH